MRGVSAKRLTAVVANAFLFRYKLSVTLPVMRSVISPGTRKSWPGTSVGRSPLPNRNDCVGWFWLTPIGKPLCSVITGDAVLRPLLAAAERQHHRRRDDDLVCRVEQAAAVLEIGVVVRRARDHRVVVLQARRARVVVALAELVVVQTAQRVADAAAPQAADALAQLEDAGVILRVRAGGLLHVDVAEFRERPHQLAARQRRLRGVRAGRGNAE